MNTTTIHVEIPNDLLSEISLDELRHVAQEAFYVRLYERGKISSGRAGAMLGVSWSDSLDLLGRYGVSYFDEQTDLAEDLRNAPRANT